MRNNNSEGLGAFRFFFKQQQQQLTIDCSNIIKTWPGRPGSSEVTSQPSDTLGREFDPGERNFSHLRKKKCPTSGECFVHKIRFHGRRGKRMAESSSREKLRHAPQKEGGSKIMSDLPPVWPRLLRPTNLMSRNNGKKTTENYVVALLVLTCTSTVPAHS